MGAHPYFYFTPYQDDIQRALDLLREQEFRAGHYHPAMRLADPPRYMFEMKFPPDAVWPSPGARHDSIKEAVDAAMEEGTGSILDLYGIASRPAFGAASPLQEGDLARFFGTARPTREVLESVLFPQEPGYAIEPLQLFWDEIKRGEGRYVVLYADSKPNEIFFAGYSWD